MADQHRVTSRRSWLGALIAGLLWVSCLSAAAAPSGVTHRLEENWLQVLAEDLQKESGTPGVGIALLTPDWSMIAVAGERAASSGVPVTPIDPWHLGSNTKSMTAMLAARLVEGGQITWDTTIGDALGDAFPEMQAPYREATLAHLLSHRAGLPANIDLARFREIAGTDAERDARKDRATYAGWILADPPAAQPGQADVYSNAGYVVAALMLEKAAGKPYETLMQEEVFGPLGMVNTGWGPPGSPDEIDAPRGHNNFGIAIPPTANADNPVAMNSAGRAHMPLNDIITYLRVHLNAALGKDPDYLTKESWAKLHKPSFDGQFAMGWVVLPNGGLAHAGSNTLWFCQFLVIPQRRTAIAIVSNSGNIQALQPHFGAAIGKILSREN